MTGMTNIHPIADPPLTTDAHEGKAELSDWRKISESAHVISNEAARIRDLLIHMGLKRYLRSAAGLRRKFRAAPFKGLGAAALAGLFYRALMRRH